MHQTLILIIYALKKKYLPGSYVECNKNIDGIMLMSSKNKKYTKNITNPCKRVQKIDFATGVFSDEKVQKRKGYSVSREHVITASTDTL